MDTEKNSGKKDTKEKGRRKLDREKKEMQEKKKGRIKMDRERKKLKGTDNERS